MFVLIHKQQYKNGGGFETRSVIGPFADEKAADGHAVEVIGAIKMTHRAYYHTSASSDTRDVWDLVPLVSPSKT